MTDAQQLPLAISAAHRNHYLFSDHYLNVLLPRDPRWEEALADAEAFLAWLQAHHRREGRHLADYNETQLEDHWFKPILEHLGHVAERQTRIPALGGGVRAPDFMLFPDEAARQQAAARQRTDEYARDALAVGEVKAWDVPLGKKAKAGGAAFDDKNPSFQIDYYLRATGLHWGILSNGRLWRLFHRDSSFRLDQYYEVDLDNLRHQGNASDMRYFLLFFRQAAMRPDARGLFLQDALEASRRYALELEEDLESNVYHALEKLMQGFLDRPQNGLGPADVRAIYDNSLYLLYRLLFILYAESRDLLPVQNNTYAQNFSMQSIQAAIKEVVDHHQQLPPMTTKYWAQLQTLFEIINGDNESLNHRLGVPRYNGGLFSPDLHPFLAEKEVGDQALVAAIDLFSRRRNPHTNQMEFVDYRTLGVRQLGSIYEGLLEYQPRIAAQPMIAVREGKAEKWLTDDGRPPTDVGAVREPPLPILDRRASGHVYLVTDKGERKATGSYYTPETIVRYIVENTLTPLIENADRRRTTDDGHQPSAAGGQPSALSEAILNLKVLDPAMGSGHFLVEATHFLARALANEAPAAAEDAPAAAEDDITYWKRQVVERCIYGVDRNPLAVELAKVSLWLATVAAGRPLSFLDHHLQCGDSLIGARVADLGWPPPAVLDKKAQKLVAQQRAGQLNLFQYRLSQQLPAVMGRVLEITGRESDTYESVQAKEAADEAVRQLKAPFAAVADVWVSGYFGNAYTLDEYNNALYAIGQPDHLGQMPAIQRAQAITAERRFFHWELAFPEVFYDANGQGLGEAAGFDAAGFDAVIGNPPYDELSEVALGRPIDEKAFLLSLQLYKEASTYRINLYRLFIAAAVDKTKVGGYQAFIVPMTLLGDRFTHMLRHKLLEECEFERVEAFPQKDDPKDRVFPDAKLSTCIYVLGRRQPDGRFFVRTHPGRDILADSPSFEPSSLEIAQFDPSSFSIPTVSAKEWKLAIKLATQANLCLLAEVAASSPGEIMFNKQFQEFLSDDPPGAIVLRGAHIGRYEFYNEPKQGSPVFLDIEKFLAKQTDKSSKAYDHQKMRIGYQRGSAIDNYRRIIATILEPGVFCSDTVGYFTASKYNLFALLAILNSQICEWRFGLTSATNHVNPYELDVIPMPRIEFTTPPALRAELLEKGQKLYQRCLEKGDEVCVTGFVEHELAQTPERADVVHDLLAFLAEQMIAMNRDKQAAIADFWLDLEGLTDPATFGRLRHKGKQEAKLAEQPALRPFLNPASHSTRTLDESLAWNEDAFKAFLKQLAPSLPNLSALVKLYRQHSPAYATLTGRLAATDHLIDQVVYRLYGLTAAEIALVERG